MPNCVYFFAPVKSPKVAAKWLRKANSKKWRRHRQYGMPGTTNYQRASTVQETNDREALWHIEVGMSNRRKAINIRHQEGWLYTNVGQIYYSHWNGKDNVSFFSYEAFRRGLIDLHLKSKREVDMWPYDNPDEPWFRAPRWRGGSYEGCQIMLRVAKQFFDKYPEGAVHVYGFDPPAIYL